MKVTIKDVAKEANVATSTVSRVLSNSPRISEETKKKVNKAIKKLNYTPNVVARGLANNRTRILAVVLPDGAEKMFSNPFFAQALKGISVCAQKENYYIMYGFKDECSSDGWIKQFTESNLVDGLCLFNAKDNDEDIEYLKKINFPFVIIGRPEEVKGVLWADNDNFQAMYLLTQKLIEMGHETIGFIGAKGNLNMSKDRLEGYKQALRSRGIELRKELAKLQKNLGGIKEMKRLPDAIFIVDPKKERICVQEAHALGIKLIGIADTNCDPDELDYVIPGNDDAIRAVKLIVAKMADAVIEANQGEEAASAVEEEVAEEA